MKRYFIYPAILLLSALLLSACSGSSEPEDTVEAFLNATAEGDMDKAIDQLSFATVDASEMNMAKGKVQMMAGELESRINANGGIDSIETLDKDVSENGNSAALRSRINYQNGKDHTENFNLIKEDGDWKITLE